MNDQTARDVVIYGLGELASVAWYVLTHDSPHRVVGFTVDGRYMDQAQSHGLPVVPFESVTERFPPDACAMILPLGWRRMNGLRRDKMALARSLGYGFVSYVSSRAMVWPDIQVGENCMIHDGVIVQPFTRIGEGCQIRGGVMVSHHVAIGDYSFIAGGVVIGGNVIVGERCVLGLNGTIRDDVTIAPRCFIGAGAVVIRDTEENGVYVGVPAKRQARPADQLDETL